MTTIRPASHPATNRKISELVTAEHIDRMDSSRTILCSCSAVIVGQKAA